MNWRYQIISITLEQMNAIAILFKHAV